MSDNTECMFDTNVFNKILDEQISPETFANRVTVYVTHIQRDEILATRNPDRRSKLAKVFGDIFATSEPTESFVLGHSRLDEAKLGGERVVPTESAVWDVSRWHEAKWADEDDLYSRLISDLNERNKSKDNNIQDALIAETSIKGGFVLVTDDADLAAVTRKYGGNSISVNELVRRCAE